LRKIRRIARSAEVPELPAAVVVYACITVGLADIIAMVVTQISSCRTASTLAAGVLPVQRLVGSAQHSHRCSLMTPSSNAELPMSSVRVPVHVLEVHQFRHQPAH
jgi:hypothetical protein